MRFVCSVSGTWRVESKHRDGSTNQTWGGECLYTHPHTVQNAAYLTYLPVLLDNNCMVSVVAEALCLLRLDCCVDIACIDEFASET